MLVREDGIHEPGFALELAARRLGQAPQPAGAGWRLGDWVIPGSEANALLLNFARGTAIPTYSLRSEEHTSELQSLMRISYAVFCLNKKRSNSATYAKTR